MDNRFLAKVQSLVFEEILRGNRVTEKKLAEQLGVSRTPIREALGSLEEQGMLERRKYHGIGLRKTSLRDLVEIYDLRTALEGVAARILAVNIDRDGLRELADLARKCGDRPAKSRRDGVSGKLAEDREYRDQLRADFEFHKKIVEKSGNRHMKRFFDVCRVLDISFRLYKIDRPVKSDDLRYSHPAIVNALKSGDPDKAERLMRGHIQGAKNSLIRIFLGPSYPAVRNSTLLKSGFRDG